MDIDWKEFIKNSSKLKPRKTLAQAVEKVDNFGNALDFGAGGLRDTRYLKRFPFNKIDALDSNEEALAIYKRMRNADKVDVFIGEFNDFEYKENYYDIINAQYSLPYIEKSSFNSVLEKLKNSLTLGGVFVGNFFGVNDAWNNGEHTDMTFLSRTEAEEVFKDFETLLIKELEYNKKDPIDGEVAKWHVIEFIVRKTKSL